MGGFDRYETSKDFVTKTLTGRQGSRTGRTLCSIFAGERGTEGLNSSTHQGQYERQPSNEAVNQRVVITYGGSEIVEVHGFKGLENPMMGVNDMKRGNVTRFSKQSRKRMKKTVGKIHKRHVPVFVTLTYPTWVEIHRNGRGKICISSREN